MRKKIAFCGKIGYTYSMDTNVKPETEPVRFRFRFSPLLVALCALGLTLCAVSLGLTTWRFVLFLGADPTSVYGWMQYVLLYGVTLALAVLIVAMLICSRYTIGDKLVLRFGLIVQKFGLEKILSVHLFRGANKLAVYFDDLKTDYLNIVIRPQEYDAFIRALQARGPHIAFTFSTAEEEAEVKKNKKK